MAQLQTQEAALAQAQAAVPALQQQRTQQHDLLAALTGRLPSQMPLQPFDLSALTLPLELPLSVPSRLVDQRPDVRIAAAELHAATAQVGVATANMLPNIALTADAGSAVESLSHLLGPGTGFWNLGGALSQTLFAGGSLEHRRKAAVATMDQAAAQYRSTVLQAFRQVADVLAALQSDAATLQAQARATAAASQSLATTQHDVQVGAASYLDLLDAQRSYNQAVIAQVSAQAARLTDTVALFQALGGGWWSPDAPPLPGRPRALVPAH
jgi:NodT family efflux transporter outer membrane factor (OMF) lipoprotein